MAKKRKAQRGPDLSDPVAIMGKAAFGALRPGELEALASHINNLELQVQTLLDQISRLQLGHKEIISSRHIGIGLSAYGTIELLFPDQHTAQIPVGLTQHDSAIAMQALMTVLRNRAVAEGRTIGAQASPTQADLHKIYQASRAQVTRIATEPKRKLAAPKDLSLADLDLDL